jgi:hypothetical protein
MSDAIPSGPQPQPQDFGTPPRQHRRHSTRSALIAAGVLALVTAGSLSLSAVTLAQSAQAQQHAQVAQAQLHRTQESLSSVRRQLADCKQAATLWKAAASDEAQAFTNWSESFPYGKLDLSRATSDVSEAKQQCPVP